MRWALVVLFSLSAFAQDAKSRLSGPDPAVRAEAARELGRAKATDAIPELEAALKDPDREVRRAAAWALERVRPPETGTDAAALSTQGKQFADQANELYNKWVLDEKFPDEGLEELLVLLRKAYACYGRAAELDDDPAYFAPIGRISKKIGNVELELQRRRYAKKQAEKGSRPPVQQPPTETTPAERPPAPVEKPPTEAPAPAKESPGDLLVKMRGARGTERFRIAEQIGKLGPDAAPVLAEALAGEDRTAHAVVALALFRAGDGGDAALFTLVSLLDAEAGPDVRLEAVQALGAIGPAAAPAVAGLLVALKDKEANIRAASATTLGQIGPGAKRASRALGDALRDADLEVRRQSAGALGEVGPAAAAGVPALLRGIDGNDSDLTRLCVQALGQIGPETKTIMPALEVQLKSANRDIREAAIRAVGNMGAEAKRAVPGLLNVVVVEQYEPLKQAAKDALVSLGEEAVPDTAKALKDERTSMRLEACGILQRIGPAAKKAAPALAATLKDKTPEVRAAAAAATGSLGAEGRSAVTALTAMLKDGEWRVRAAAAAALGGIGPEAKGAVKALTAALADAEPEVRAAAQAALAAIAK